MYKKKKPFRCKYCPKVYESRQIKEFKAHLLEKHPNIDKDKKL